MTGKYPAKLNFEVMWQAIGRQIKKKMALSRMARRDTVDDLRAAVSHFWLDLRRLTASIV
jgi:hypothetical protein